MNKKLKHSFYGMAAVLLALSLWGIHQGIFKLHTQESLDKAYERIGLYKSSLNNELTRFDFLPFVIAHDKEMIANLLARPEQASRALQEIKLASGADELFILDQSGKTLASSNWQSSLSFVGRNYGYRQYFKDAISGHKGQFYGIGATTRKPGYFIATGILRNEIITAVAVAKVSLSILEQSWIDAGESIFLSNQDGVVILSSDDSWRYKTLHPLSQAQLKIVLEQKQFADQALTPLSDTNGNTKNRLRLGNTTYIQKVESLVNPGWNLHYLIPVHKVTQLAMITWGKIGLILLAILASLLIYRIVQSRAALNRSLEESATLRKLNLRLETEVEHRKQVETDLRAAEDDIKRSSKLVAMGQLSASMIHELSQPLSAMKTYIAGAQLPQNELLTPLEQQQTVLPKIDALIERMTQITRQLRFFARSDVQALKPVDIREALTGALLITQAGIEKEAVELHIEQTEYPLMVLAEQVRMEQVFINLICNAIAAMKLAQSKLLTIRMFPQTTDQVIIEVEDSGDGLTEGALNMLFEPFYSTKASGEGMGLGLTISANIVSEFSGTLQARNNPRHGACFIITLPGHS